MSDFLALVVEDDAALRMIYARLLSAQGYRVLEAANGSDALDILAEQTPHLIFLDMLLPYVRGDKVAEFIAQTPRFAKTHVVIASSNKEYEPFSRLVAWGRFILKPILPNQIREIAQYAITETSRE